MIETLQSALALHQQNRQAEARSLCQQVLAQSPFHFGALHLLGVIAAAERQYDEADLIIAQALAINPGAAGAWNSRGATLLQLVRLDAALVSFDHALALRPDHVDATFNRSNALAALKRPMDALAGYDRVLLLKRGHADALNNRAIVLVDLGRLDDAVAAFGDALAVAPDAVRLLNGRALVQMQRLHWAEALADFDAVLRVEPRSPAALNGRGMALIELARHEEALESFDRALAVNPSDVGVLNNRGGVLAQIDRLADAHRAYDRALAYQPNSVTALSNRGVLQGKQNRPDQALASYDCALALNPDHIEALSNRGTALIALKRPRDAVDDFDRALAIRPAFAEALSNRGKALMALQRFDDAKSSFDRALAIRPDYPEALVNRAHILRQMGQFDLAAQTLRRLVALDRDYPYAVGQMFDAQLHGCDWSAYDVMSQRIWNDVRAGKRADFPFSFLAHSRSAADQLQCGRIFGADRHPPSAQPLWTGQRYRHDRLRVAYVSADFWEHPVARLTVGLFEMHDKQQFELTAISLGRQSEGELHSRLQRAFDRFIDVRSMSDQDTAALLHDLEIDIAVDMSGFTADSRTGIFACRPAPIQVSYMGFPGPMGVPYIDYIIADRHVIPQADRDSYAERIAYLPDTYWVTDSKLRIAERTPSRREAGLPDAGFVFCCFNNNYKITPEIFDVWMRLLLRVDNSTLWLLAANPVAMDNLRREAGQRGIAAERLVFAPRTTPDAHLARHRLADLFLDTLPYNAHTTASDALWVGLPVVTCQGDTFVSRVAGSLLRAIGLPELITDSLPAYEALALTLATTPAMLADIKERLARQRTTHPLFDTDRFRRHIESAYRTMWQRHQLGAPPASFDAASQPIA